jgi:hypothetical protein
VIVDVEREDVVDPAGALEDSVSAQRLGAFDEAKRVCVAGSLGAALAIEARNGRQLASRAAV